MTRYRIVPEDRLKACADAFASFLADVGNSPGSYQWDRVDELRAMLQATPAPSEEVIDEMITSALDAAYGKCGASVTANTIRKVQADAIRTFLTALSAGAPNAQ